MKRRDRNKSKMSGSVSDRIKIIHCDPSEPMVDYRVLIAMGVCIVEFVVLGIVMWSNG